MKVVEQEHVFQHDWNTITAAFLQKYPNPLQPHVRRIDTVAREIDAQRAVIRTRRILQVEYGLPAWVMRLFNIKQEGFVVEDCVVDVKNKHLKLYSENITYNGLLSVKESCSYRAHPANPAKTLYKANSSYKVFAPGLSCALEHAVANVSREKASQGVNAIDFVVTKMKNANAPSSAAHRSVDALPSGGQEATAAARLPFRPSTSTCEDTAT
eukprot:Selendium_serpulae@DN1814_c0_g1_i5.p1